MKWHVTSCEVVGTKNRERELHCQGGRIYRTEEGIQVVSLADMKDRTKKTASFSRETAKMLAHFLVENDEMIFISDENTIRYNLFVQLERWIEEKRREYGVAKQRLQASILAVMVDSEEKNYCLIQLGEGAIAVWNEDKKVYLLSEGGTDYRDEKECLKGNDEAVSYLKVRKGRMKNIKGFLLASGGIYSGYHDFPSLKEIFRRRRSRDILSENEEEDQSLILFMKE